MEIIHEMEQVTTASTKSVIIKNDGIIYCIDIWFDGNDFGSKWFICDTPKLIKEFEETNDYLNDKIKWKKCDEPDWADDCDELDIHQLFD